MTAKKKDSDDEEKVVRRSYRLSDMKNRDEDGERKGLECPECGCHHFLTVYTRPRRGGAIRRKKECRFCGHRISTEERAMGGRKD